MSDLTDMPDVIYADNDVNMPSGGIWSHQSIEGHDTPYIRTPEGVNPHDSEVVLTACVNEMTENLRPVTDMEEPWTLRKAAAVAATRITELEVERGEIILTLEAQDLSLAAKDARIAELKERAEKAEDLADREAERHLIKIAELEGKNESDIKKLVGVITRITELVAERDAATLNLANLAEKGEH